MSSDAAVALVVGLGNPGRRYEATRHNVGFRVLAELARRHATGRPKSRFEGELVETNVGGKRILLLSPMTFMNNSGRSVRAAFDFYKLRLQDVLVVCDDINLPTAKLRFRAGGSAGGQKGLADAIRSLGSQEFSRLRIGVGSPPSGWDAADYVLGRFAKNELDEVERAIVLGADSVLDWVEKGIDHCMNHYN